jgi:hypothetical protein
MPVFASRMRCDQLHAMLLLPACINRIGVKDVNPESRREAARL